MKKISLFIVLLLTSSTSFANHFGLFFNEQNLNYWGDGSDGNFISTGTSSDQLCDNNVDGPTCVKQYNNFTINSGHTVTTAVRRNGLVIYVKGDANIYGTLSMSGKGSAQDPASAGVPAGGITFVRRTKSGTSSGSSSVGGTSSTLQAIESNQSSAIGNGVIINIPRYGGTGAAIQTSLASGNAGGNGGSLQAGGGGGGASGYNGGTVGYGGIGGNASCFGGGAGGGGGSFQNSSGQGGTGANYGGAGGFGSTYGGANFGTGGGAGNPGGAAGVAGSSGSAGVGGLVILFVKGNLFINGTISAVGSTGGAASGGALSNAGGGGSGGGIVVLVWGKSRSGNGNVFNGGGNGGTASGGSYGSKNGGAGGLGSINLFQVVP
jgi:hypothetical protein